MTPTEGEKFCDGRGCAFVKAALARSGVGYRDLAARLKDHGLDETEASVAAKLARGTLAVSFLLACLAALGIHGVPPEQLGVLTDQLAPGGAGYG